jgi:hypothetical protein
VSGICPEFTPATRSGQLKNFQLFVSKILFFQLADGKKTLRLTNFATSNGPDVHVYLVAVNDAKDNDTVSRAAVVDIGTLKGNIGDQNYDLPANTDLAKYRAVTIWCKRFSVNFGTAPLMTDSMQSMVVR